MLFLDFIPRLSRCSLHSLEPIFAAHHRLGRPPPLHPSCLSSLLPSGISLSTASAAGHHVALRSSIAGALSLRASIALLDDSDILIAFLCAVPSLAVCGARTGRWSDRSVAYRLFYSLHLVVSV